MRNTKYRGLDGLNNWVYGLPSMSTAIGWNPSCIEQCFDSRRYARTNVVIDKIDTITQFTGFFDNKGNEIYEGDILSDSINTDEGLIQSKMQVFWCNKLGAWRLDNSYGQDKTSGDLLSDELADFAYEITGNIYEEQN